MPVGLGSLGPTPAAAAGAGGSGSTAAGGAGSANAGGGAAALGGGGGAAVSSLMEGLQDVEQIDYKLGAQVLKLRWEVSSSDVWGMCRGCNACLGFVDTDVGGAA